MPFYFKYLDKYNIVLIGIHIIIGVVVSDSSQLATFWGLGSFFTGILIIFKYKNRFNDAANFAGYIIGMEIVLRMTRASVFWEFGKYATIALLLIGMLIENIRYLRINLLSLAYIVSLIPSIFFLANFHGGAFNWSYFRTQLSLNLSGPTCLFICLLYFRNRFITGYQLKSLFRIIILPIITLSAIIIIRMPTLENLVFSSEANFQMSGGYGPNQVSTILGIAIIIIGISKLLNFKLFTFNILDNAIMTVATGIALLTYARGGVLAPFIAVLIGYNFAFLRKGIGITRILTILTAILILFSAASYFTEGSIAKRYSQLLEVPFEEQSNLSGRSLIMAIDYQIFLDNPFLGVGPGGATRMRAYYGYGNTVSAHSEFTRMLSEHGIFGAFSLLSLFTLLITEFFKRSRRDSIILMIFCSFSILTMFHSAFRMAAPGFIYGLAYVFVKDNFK
ncbi:MAG: hypothetical protein CMG55_08865 [Candidatus Marinimicrobia bacterium]|nr:hypothetical protein [Candidatus Neomarinimicrobiota bacterium]|tara:strand:+ start:1275 stop:2621 length:1347 start_codon:yes stop_codon:yes gene_type:complete